MIIKIEGQLEIDRERGVIYFHSAMTGATMLRVCNLPKPIPDPRWIISNGAVKKTGVMLDITHGYGANWGSDQERHCREHRGMVNID